MAILGCRHGVLDRLPQEEVAAMVGLEVMSDMCSSSDSAMLEIRRCSVIHRTRGTTCESQVRCLRLAVDTILSPASGIPSLWDCR